MIDFAHLNDYILLKNFKLQNLRDTWHIRGFDSSFINKIRVMSSILSANLENKITISQFGTTVA